jgi:hypothetical protein
MPQDLCAGLPVVRPGCIARTQRPIRDIAIKSRDEVAARMTPDQIAEAQLLLAVDPQQSRRQRRDPSCRFSAGLRPSTALGALMVYIDTNTPTDTGP